MDSVACGRAFVLDMLVRLSHTKRAYHVSVNCSLTTHVVDIKGALFFEMTTGILFTCMRLIKTIGDMRVELNPLYERYKDLKGCITEQVCRAPYCSVELAVLQAVPHFVKTTSK
jgi:hypothetical protein